MAIDPYAKMNAVIQNAIADGLKSLTNDISIGVVRRMSPLTIQIDKKHTLTSDYLIVSSALKELKIEVDMSHGHDAQPPAISAEITLDTFRGNTQIQAASELSPNPPMPNPANDHNHEMTHTHNVQTSVNAESGKIGENELKIEIEIFKGLAVGDRVICFPFNNGQKYYIAERVG